MAATARANPADDERTSEPSYSIGGPSGERSKPLDEVKERLRDLSVLLTSARELGVDAGEAIETAQEVERRLARGECNVLLAGEDAARRAVLDTVLGERVFGAALAPAKVVTRIRKGATVDYAARLRSGIVMKFGLRMPMQDEAVSSALVLAERDRAAAAESATALATWIETAQRQRKTSPSLESHVARSWFAQLWLRIVAFFVAFFRKPEPALPPDTGIRRIRPREDTPLEDAWNGEPTRAAQASLAELEEIARGAGARLERASVRIAQLQADCERYTAERKAAFFADLRSFADEASRGSEVIELSVELPSENLPAGATLLDDPELAEAPGDARARGVDGCLFAADDSQPSSARFKAVVQAMQPMLPHSIDRESSRASVKERIATVRDEAPLAAGARVVALARKCIGRAAHEAAQKEAVHRERVATLEAQRLSEPAAFRARALSSVAPAIEEQSAAIVFQSLERLAPQLAEIESEWTRAVMACTDRKAVEQCVRSINEGAERRLLSIVEGMNELVIGEMQRASEHMQRALVEELHQRHQMVRRLSMSSISDGIAPVIADVGGEDLAALGLPPLAGALDAFESRRVGFGLGGAAAGAVLGTMIAPIIGTAIGAFLGVFAGFFEGVDSLKQDCVAKLRGCLTEAGVQIRAHFESRRAGLAADLRGSIEEGVDHSLQRLERAIAGLIAVEEVILNASSEKLTRLGALNASVEAHERRFAALSGELR